MLHNPKWQKSLNKQRAFMLDNLIDWLERQPPTITYDFFNNQECMLCQYFQAQGYDEVMVTTTCLSYRDDDNPSGGRSLAHLPEGWNAISRGTRDPKEIAIAGDTFGDALERARAAR